MTEIESIATQRRASARLIGGTLRFWGKWFGGAHDNIHTVIGCNVDNDCLRVYFDEGEILSVWFRRQGTDNGDTFRIVDGQCLRWEWFYYGRAKVRKNLYFQEVVKSGNTIVASTKIDWYTPRFAPDPLQPAVEML